MTALSPSSAGPAPSQPVVLDPGEPGALWSTPIRDLGLTIRGTRLEPILAEFER